MLLMQVLDDFVFIIFFMLGDWAKGSTMATPFRDYHPFPCSRAWSNFFPECGSPPRHHSVVGLHRVILDYFGLYRGYIGLYRVILGQILQYLQVAVRVRPLLQREIDAGVASSGLGLRGVHGV